MAVLRLEGRFRSSGQGPSLSLGVREGLPEEMEFEPKDKNVGRCGRRMMPFIQKKRPRKAGRFYHAHNVTKELKETQRECV